MKYDCGHCGHCGKQFKMPSALYAHVKNKHGSIAAAEGEEDTAAAAGGETEEAEEELAEERPAAAPSARDTYAELSLFANSVSGEIPNEYGKHICDGSFRSDLHHVLLDISAIYQCILLHYGSFGSLP